LREKGYGMSTVSSLGKYFLPGELYAPGDFGVKPHRADGGKNRMPGGPQVEEIAVIARWLVRLRWIAICGFLVLALSYSLLPQSVLPVPALYGVCLVLIIYNVAFFVIFKTRALAAARHELFCIRLQVLFDWVALFLFIHFTGGIFSPIVFFVILHIIINAMIFPPAQCYWYTTFSLLGFGALFLIENVFRIFPVTNPWFGKSVLELAFVPLLIAFILFSLVLYASTFLATSIMSRFRQREQLVHSLGRNLKRALTRMETLYDATTMMVTSYDMREVLDRLVQESVRIMEAQGAALRLVQRNTSELATVAACGLSEAYLGKGPVTIEDGLVPRSADEVIIVDDVEHDPRLRYPQEAAREGIGSIISILLVSKGAVKGNLRLYAADPHHFTGEELPFLKVLANGTAVIIDNVQAWMALEESNRRIVSFAYQIGHDLKSPVSAVQSLLTAMREGYAGSIPPRQQDILARCINKQEHLLMLIRDLLNLAEGQVPAEGQKMAAVFIDAAAAEVIKLFEAVSTHKGVAVVALLPGQPIPFEEIPGDFQRLFANLLDNALRYTPPGGRVEIEAGCDERRITISVRDNGMGIEPEYREKIFEEFFRTPRAKQCLAEGTGLGLAIVRNIVNRYHGSIRLESEPGKGTAFIITFPRRKQ
jgi:signal transduction histidine kinase